MDKHNQLMNCDDVEQYLAAEEKKTLFYAFKP
jgi:hypothetical protein